MNDADYRIVRGRRTNNTPLLAIVSGSEHEEAVMRREPLADDDEIVCGTSLEVSGKAKFLYWDFTEAGELFVTEKCRAILESTAPNSFIYYKAAMAFMQAEGPFYIIRPRYSHIGVDMQRSTREDGEFLGIALEESFYLDIPEAERMAFELEDARDTLCVHKAVIEAFEAANIGGWCAYELDTWNSNPFDDDELIDPGKHWMLGEPIG